MAAETGQRPPAEKAIEEQRLLCFRCGGERFAFDIAYVREIVIDEEVTPVPLAPGSVAGVLNHRGMIYTIVGFAALSGLNTAGAAGKVLLLHYPGMWVGIAVEEIEDIIHVAPAVLEKAGAAPDGGGGRRFIKGVFEYAGAAVTLADAEALADVIYHLDSGGATAAGRT